MRFVYFSSKVTPSWWSFLNRIHPKHRGARGRGSSWSGRRGGAGDGGSDWGWVWGGSPGGGGWRQSTPPYWLRHGSNLASYFIVLSTFGFLIVRNIVSANVRAIIMRTIKIFHLVNCDFLNTKVSNGMEQNSGLIVMETLLYTEKKM